MALTPVVAIVGRPNVGKSTLFNRLVGFRRAITSETSGTTRDAVYSRVEWGKYNFLLVDTAGLDKATGELDEQIQEQVAQVARSADVLVVVADASNMITTSDQQAAKLALKSGKPVILALNKVDAASKGLADNFIRLGVKAMVEVSALHGRGTGDLLDAITGVVEQVDAPEEEPVIRVALLGRPNVGKSSLFNNLAEKQQALVSSTAGTTRDINHLRLRYHQQDIELMDTAGLVRPSKVRPGVEKYSSLRTISAIAQADICILLMDATEPAVARDQNIAGLAVEAGRGLILVVNKWDQVDKDEHTQARIAARIQADFQFCWWAPLVFTAATTGQNTTKLFELITQIHERRQTEIPTSQLNQLLQRMLTKQPPAGLKGKQPKLNYMTQTGTQPPRFTIFGTYPELMHFSYQRYLENGLRAEVDFVGTPIQLEFRDKRGTK